MAHALLLILHVVAYEIIVPTFCSQLLLLLRSCSVPPTPSTGCSVVNHGALYSASRETADPPDPHVTWRSVRCFLLCSSDYCVIRELKRHYNSAAVIIFCGTKILGIYPRGKKTYIGLSPALKEQARAPGDRHRGGRWGAHLLTSL